MDLHNSNWITQTHWLLKIGSSDREKKMVSHGNHGKKLQNEIDWSIGVWRSNQTTPFAGKLRKWASSSLLVCRSSEEFLVLSRRLLRSGKPLSFANLPRSLVDCSRSWSLSYSSEGVVSVESKASTARPTGLLNFRSIGNYSCLWFSKWWILG